MFWERTLREQPQFQAGVRDMWQQSTGIAAWGLMTGVAMVKAGLSVTESLVMMVLVYAGSSQLAALPLLVAGAPAWVILATALCVNLRFVVFSLHLRPYFIHMSLARRLATGYLFADLNYALHTQRYPLPAQDAPGRLAQEAYWAGHCGITWTSWMLASALGIALAHVIPTAWGLGFAGILCLVAILCSLASTRLRLIGAAAAGITAVAAYALPLKLNIVLAIGVAVLVCLSLEHRLRPAEGPR